MISAIGDYQEDYRHDYEYKPFNFVCEKRKVDYESIKIVEHMFVADFDFVAGRLWVLAVDKRRLVEK